MKNALIIFVRKPEAGKVKTRLAAQIGAEKALTVYIKLLQHTQQVCKSTNADKYLFGAETKQDVFWDGFFQARQYGHDLGSRMMNAFNYLFNKQYEGVVIIGSDCPYLTDVIIKKAFDELKEKDAVIGPAEDGGYYLLGMKKLHINIFQNKNWSTPSVFTETIKGFQLLNLQYSILPVLNDVDEEKDIPPNWLFSTV